MSTNSEPSLRGFIHLGKSSSVQSIANEPMTLWTPELNFPFVAVGFAKTS
jgi:hypothetical protein